MGTLVVIAAGLDLVNLKNVLIWLHLILRQKLSIREAKSGRGQLVLLLSLIENSVRLGH